MLKRWTTVALYSEGTALRSGRCAGMESSRWGETVSYDEIGIAGAAPESAISVTLSHDGSTVARCDLAGGAPILQAVDRVEVDRIGVEVGLQTLSAEVPRCRPTTVRRRPAVPPAAVLRHQTT